MPTCALPRMPISTTNACQLGRIEVALAATAGRIVGIAVTRPRVRKSPFLQRIKASPQLVYAKRRGRKTRFRFYDSAAACGERHSGRSHFSRRTIAYPAITQTNEKRLTKTGADIGS